MGRYACVFVNADLRGPGTSTFWIGRIIAVISGMHSMSSLGYVPSFYNPSDAPTRYDPFCTAHLQALSFMRADLSATRAARRRGVEVWRGRATLAPRVIDSISTRAAMPPWGRTDQAAPL